MTKTVKTADLLDTLIQKYGTFPLLKSLSLYAILPVNQFRELRLFHIAQIILSKPISNGSISPSSESITKLIEWHNDIYGISFIPLESDIGPVPFVSWIYYSDSVFRVPTGSYGNSDVFLTDLIEKITALSDEIEESIGLSGSSLCNFFLSRIESFMRDSSLGRMDFANNKESYGEISAEELNLIENAFQKHLIFEGRILSSKMRKAFDKLCLTLGEQDPAMSPAGIAALGFAMLKYKDSYAILFPQRFFPSLLGKLCDLIKWDKSQAVCDTLNARLLHRSFMALSAKFDPVIPVPTVDGNQLSQIMCTADRKVFLLNMFLNCADRRSERMKEVVENSIAAWNKHSKKAVLRMKSWGGNATLNNPSEYQPIFISIVDGLKKTDNCTFTEALQLDVPHLILSTQQLEFILVECEDDMEFIKFIRSLHRLNQRPVACLGTDILDLFAHFKWEGGMGPRGEFPTKITALMLDTYAFQKYNLERLMEFRKKNRLVFKGEGNAIYSLHYPRVLKKEITEGTEHWIITDSELSIEMSSEIPVEEMNADAGDNLHATWYLTTDSLCCRLGETVERISEKLSSLPKIKRITIEIRALSGNEEVTALSKRIGDEVACVISFSTQIQNGFSSNNNLGERTIFNAFINSLAQILPDLDWSELLIEYSEFSNFRLKISPVRHVSLLENIRPVAIYSSDEWLVDEILGSALIENSSSDKEYSEDQILDKLKPSLEALKKELTKRLSSYDHDMIVTWAYNQLEVAEIYYRKMLNDLAFRTLTAVYADPATKYKDLSTDYTELKFALRLLIEATISGGGEALYIPSLEECTELLAVCRKIIQLDFMGDSIWFLKSFRDEPLKLFISEFGNITLKGDSPHVLLAQNNSIKEHAEFVEDKNDGHDLSVPTKEEVGLHFDEAFLEKYGYSFSDRLRVIVTLKSIFDEMDEPVFSMPRAEITKRISDLANLEKNVVESVLESIVLNKQTLNSNHFFTPSEKYWRDGRLLNRPLVQLKSGKLHFTRSYLESAALIFFKRTINTRFDLDNETSEKFKKAVGDWASQYGLLFEKDVHDVFQRFEWPVFHGIKTINNIAIPMESIGPIDVIAINQQTHTIYIVECKRNSESRNPKELKTERGKFFGTKSDIGYLKRIRNKTNWIRTHWNDVKVHYKLDHSHPWKIQSMLVSTEFLCSVNAKRPEDILVITWSQLPEFIQKAQELSEQLA